jgi:outer membrane protein insertion porin family
LNRSFLRAAAGAVLWLSAAAHAQTLPVPPPPAPVPPPAESAPAVPVVAPATPAPAPASGERIVGARVAGTSTVTAETILFYLGVRVGDAYDPERLRKNFEQLWKSDLFENVQIEAEHGPSGVTLVFTVEERPTIKAVDFSGNRKLTVTQIREKMTQQKATIKVGIPLSMKNVQAALQAIRDVYLENGFRSATVDWRLEGTAKTNKKLVFVIDEGEKIKIRSIRFAGNTVFSAAHLRLAMKKTKIATWWRLLSDKTVFNQANFDEDMESVKHLYQDHGYKDVVLREPSLDIYVANPKQKKPKKIRKKVRISIPVVEGERYYFGKIDVATDEGEPKVVPKAQILRDFRDCREGEVLSRERLIEGLSAVETKYKRKGYIYWFADPQYQPARSDRRVDVLVKMYEGDAFRMGRTEFSGNSMTRDKVLRREVTIDEGQILDMEAFKKSLTKISQLGYFKLSEEPQFAPDNTTKTVDVKITGQEASRNELNFGAGYSGFDGFFGQFSFATRNFLGRGEVLSASVQLGKITKLYDLGYTMPWFHDQRQTVGGSIYSRQSTYLGIDDRRKGISIFYGRQLGVFDSYALGYGLEAIRSRYPVQPAPVPPGFPIPPLATSLVDGTTSSITPSYQYDSTNDPFDPSTGYKGHIALQYAGIGGSNYFVKPILSGTAFVPFLRHKYFGFHLEGGYVRPLAGRELPIFERFQIGGEQSLRGFGIGSVVPLGRDHRIFVDDKGRILGGDKYALLNAEYIFATIGPVKALVFGDVGNTWIESQSFGLGGIRSSAGLELRLLLPIFQAPLRFIYSWNLHPIQPLDQFGFPISRLKERRSGFDFSIGTSF